MHTEVYLDAVATKNNADGLGYVVNPQAVPKTQTRKKFWPFKLLVNASCTLGFRIFNVALCKLDFWS